MEDDDEYKTVDVQRQEDTEQTFKNPCNEKNCKRGEVCVLNEGEAMCVCQTCEYTDGEEPIEVCSTGNVTYNSECELDRDHCLCKQSQPGCSDTNAKKIRLDYYSACKELLPCPDNEFEQFGGRMKQWLFQIMRELAMRSELTEDYRDLLVSATEDKEHADAVIWKFCDLDKDPEDRSVTRRELMYITASIKPMERCLVPFLNKCDSDNDNNISLMEWGTCLDVGHEAIIDRCHHPKNANRG